MVAHAIGGGGAGIGPVIGIIAGVIVGCALVVRASVVLAASGGVCSARVTLGKEGVRFSQGQAWVRVNSPAVVCTPTPPSTFPSPLDDTTSSTAGPSHPCFSGCVVCSLQ